MGGPHCPAARTSCPIRNRERENEGADRTDLYCGGLQSQDDNLSGLLHALCHG